MAYPDLTESNRVQEDRYKSRPVIAAPREEAVPTGVGVEFGGSPAADTAVKAAVGIGGSIDYGKEFGINQPATPGQVGSVGGPPRAAAQPQAQPAPAAEQPQDYSTRSYTVPSREPVITADALRPRTESTIDQANREASAKLDIMRAREAQGLRESNEAMRAGGAQAQASYDAGQLKREADFARFRATNGADVVLGGGGERRRYGAAADAAEARATAAQAAVGTAGINRPVIGNQVADAVAGNEATNRAKLTTNAVQQTALDQQKGVIGTAIAQQELEQKQRINQLGATLANSNNPKEREKASSALLAMLGKDKPEEYQVIHAAGGTRLGPDGFTPIRDPDNVVVINKRTGAREVIPMGQQAAPQGPAQQYEEGKIYTDPVSKKSARYVNGKWVPI